MRYESSKIWELHVRDCVSPDHDGDANHGIGKDDLGKVSELWSDCLQRWPSVAVNERRQFNKICLKVKWPIEHTAVAVGVVTFWKVTSVWGRPSGLGYLSVPSWSWWLWWWRWFWFWGWLRSFICCNIWFVLICMVGSLVGECHTANLWLDHSKKTFNLTNNALYLQVKSDSALGSFPCHISRHQMTPFNYELFCGNTSMKLGSLIYQYQNGTWPTLFNPT